jgi:hypothetical protein
MARMPQIPQPEFSGRPGGSLGAGRELPDAKSIAEPFDDAARTVAGTGDRLERLQAQRDTAAAELQKVKDATTADQLEADHKIASNALLESIQQQHFDNPRAMPAEKVPQEFERQLREMTNGEIQVESSPSVALKIAEKYAKSDGESRLSAQSWLFRRQAQEVKDGAYKAAQSNVRLAQAQSTVEGLGATIADARRKLGPTFSQVHGADAGKAMQEMGRDMAGSWVEANGPTNPRGVRAAVDDAIMNKRGPLWENLPAHQLAGYQKKLNEWGKGYGERQRGTVAAEAVDFNTKTLDLFHSKELDSKNFYQMRDSLTHKQLAIKHDPQYKDNPDEQVKQSEIVQTQIDTLEALKNASEGSGHWADKFDAKKTAALFKRYEALSKSDHRAPNDLLGVLQVQRDLAQMQAEHKISPGDAATLTRSLRLLTGKSLSKSSGPQVGPMTSPIKPDAPRTVGASALDAHIKSGAYGKLSPEQATQMRVEYHRMTTDAGETGRNLDEVGAKKMALLAIQHVLARTKTAAHGEGE